MNTWTLALAAAAASGLIACASPYQPPPAGMPSAAFTLSTTTYGSALFSLVDVKSCPSPGRQGLPGLGLTFVGASLGESAKRSTEPMRVAAGKPLHLVASIAGTTCLWAADFRVEDGAAYDATLHATNNTCWLRVYRSHGQVSGAQRLEPVPGARVRLLKSFGDVCR